MLFDLDDNVGAVDDADTDCACHWHCGGCSDDDADVLFFIDEN
jgi:hypothetical protein